MIEALPAVRLPSSLGQRVGLVAALWVAGGLLLAVSALAWQASQMGGLPLIHAPLLAPALGFATVSFVLRAFRWHVFLHAVGARPPFRTSLRTQLIGFSLTMTPGKVGELYKAYLIEQRTGVPTARIAPIVLVEKLMDGLAFTGLAILAGAALFGAAQAISSDARALAIFVAVVLALWIVVRLTRPKRVEDTVRRLIRRVPKADRIAATIGTALQGGADVLHGRLLAGNLAISFVARCCDGLAMTCVAWALGLDIPALAGVFVLNSSGALGGLSMLPGGIGVVEAGMSVLLVSLGVAPGAALLATLLARLFSFWIWVAIGLTLLLRSSLDFSRRSAD